jgi:hypothetical protein
MTATTPRTPVVLGVTPGCGATTLARALHAHDGGPRDAAADVIVCAGTEESLRRAEMLAVGAERPLLAVVLTGSGPAPARPRLRLAGRRYATVVVVPHVARWASRSASPVDVATLLGIRPERLPREQRSAAAAIRALATALVGTGLLDRPRPPVVARPLPTRGREAPRPLAVTEIPLVVVPVVSELPVSELPAPGRATPVKRPATIRVAPRIPVTPAVTTATATWAGVGAPIPGIADIDRADLDDEALEAALPGS